MKEILRDIGQFSATDLALFEQCTVQKNIQKSELLLQQGTVCQSACYILSGAFYQFEVREGGENIIDLHIANEWMFNQQSLVEQKPSDSFIKAFIDSVIIELSLSQLHLLISASSTFLQLGKIFNQPQSRVHLFDHALSPVKKYRYIIETKPGLSNIFPVKMIASFLKMAPETLSRVRANQLIS